MSFDTYAALQSEIVGWLHRSDMSGNIPSMIALAEAKMNRVLRVRAMDETTSLTLATGLSYIAFPSRCAEVQSVGLAVDGGYSWLQYVEPRKLEGLYSTTRGDPCAYSISTRIDFDKPAGADKSISVKYWKALNLATDSTNWVLLNAPDVYLYGALVHAEGFRKNDERMQVWGSLFNGSMSELNTSEARSSSNSATLVTEFQTHGYDITRE